MATIFREVLSCALLCSAVASCGGNGTPPGGTTAGLGGSGGTSPHEGGTPGGGAAGEGGGGRDGAGGSGNSGGASPTDGAGACAGFVSFGDPSVERAAVRFFDAGPVLAEHARHVDFLQVNFTPTEPLTSLRGLECFTGLRRLNIRGPDLPSW